MSADPHESFAEPAADGSATAPRAAVRTLPQGPQAEAVQRHLQRLAQRGESPWLHTEVARRMAERLSWIKRKPDHVIDWWSAQGGSRELLRAACPQARLDAVEPSAALRELTRRGLHAPWWSARRWSGAASQVWLEAEAPCEGRAHMLWANMMLHWAADPATVFAQWRERLAIDGFVMFSCFGPDTLRGLRRLYREQGWGEASQAFIDMHDLGDAMLTAGFAEPVMDMETLQLSWADAPTMFTELRSLGTNTAHARHAGLRTPRWCERLHREARQGLSGTDGRLTMAFEIVYGHAFVPPPRLKVASEVRVSVEELRRMARRGAAAGPKGDGEA